MTYIYQGIVPTFTWTIWKQASVVKEDIDLEHLKVILYGPANKYCVVDNLRIVDGDVCASLPQLADGFPVGVYTMKAFWTKDALLANGRVLSAELNCFIAFTDNVDEVPYTDRPVHLTLQSTVSSYGRDGLSAYELAVLYGQAIDSEQNPIDEQTWVSTLSSFVENEQQRNLDYEAAEGDRNALYEAAEASRNDEFDRFMESAEDRVASLTVSQSLGLSETAAVAQKTITEALQAIWQKLEYVTGEQYLGMHVEVTPTFFTGSSCTVDVTASLADLGKTFSSIAVTIGGETFTGEETATFTCQKVITTAVDVSVVAVIDGMTYTYSQAITRNPEFWMAGLTAAEIADPGVESIMTEDYRKDIGTDMRGSFDVDLETDDYLVIVIGSDLASSFVRADLNGFEIPMQAVQTITVDDAEYDVYISANSYQTGTYNIDINS